jgi:PAS domain S-box-containing protein
MHLPDLRRRPRSIRFWLTWLVIGCILPATSVAAFLLTQSYEQQRANLEAVRIDTARALMQAVDNDFAGAASVLHVLAGSPLLASGDLAGFRVVAANAVTAAHAGNIVLSMASGAQVMNTLKPFGTPLPAVGNIEMQRGTLEPGGLIVSGVLNGRVAVGPLAAIQIPVMIDGSVKYTIAMTFYTEHLGEILLRQHLPPGWMAALFDQHGVIAARTASADDFADALDAADAVRDLAKSPEGAFDLVSLEGRPIRATFSRSAASGWAIVIAIPAGLATAELQRSLWLDAAGALAVLLLGVELARRISGRIARSIHALATPALASRSGVMVVSPVVDITEVADSLARMQPLAVSEARLRDVTEGASDWIWETDAELRLTFVSVRLGYTSDIPWANISGQPFGNLVALGFDRAGMAELQAVIAPRGSFQDVVHPVMAADGTTRFWRMSGWPYFDATTETFAGYRGTGLDDTAKVEHTAALTAAVQRAEEAEQSTAAAAAEALAASEQYRLLAENCTDLIIVVDRQFIRHYVSPSCRELLGYAPEELVGKSGVAMLHPEDVERVTAGFRELFAANGRDRDRFTYRLRHRDGHWVRIESVSKVVSYTDAGAPLEVCAALRDIGERLTLESALRDTKEQLHLLLPSGVAEAFYLLDRDGRIEALNASAEQIKGYATAEVIGQDFAMFFTPEDIALGEPARVLSMARESGHYDAETWRVRKDGSRFLARIAMDAIYRDDGTLRGFVNVTLDITNQRFEEAQRNRLTRNLAEARDQAEHASQAKSRFLAGITHELRTPLHGILGYAELMSLEGGLNPTQAERLEVMMASGQHLLAMINAVLDMSQIEADQLELQPVAIDLADLVRVCFNVIRPAAEAKGLALVLPPPMPLRLFADPTRLRQVLINLLANAVKFTRAGAVEVRLRATEGNACIRLEVADTGPGIPPINRDKLFQTFERLNAQAVSGIEGAGLGLAIAARLVRSMGGQIGYADNAGGGSVFWLELPAHDAVPEAQAAAPARAPPALGRRLRVLVADDEALNRNIASGFLNNAGHDVVCVDNGAAAVEAAASEDFDVILMDVRMPGMNGLEATRRIRGLPGPRGKVRVVAVTAQAFAEQIRMCRQAGMDGHVAKPFKPAVLLAALENLEAAPDGQSPAVVPSAEVPPAVAPGAVVPLAVVPLGNATADPESGHPVFDRTMLEAIAELLPAAELAEYMETLITRCEALLRGLRRPGILAQPDDLITEAHSLAGGAGTFGFLRLADAARRFERAAESGAAETMVLAGRLAVTVEAALVIMQQELTCVADLTA